MIFIKHFLEKITDLPSIYPEISLPMKESDLRGMYKNFNLKYFQGYLPEDIKISISSKSSKWYGLASSSSIKINKFIGMYRKEIIDTLLHEMIHIWQFKKVKETGDRSYITVSRAEKTIEKKTYAHNSYFFSWADKLNSIGFDINEKADREVDVDMEDEMYGVVIYLEDEKYVLAYQKEQFDPMVVADELQSFSPKNFTKYLYFSTKDINIIPYTKLVKGHIRKNYRFGVYTNKQYLEAMINSSLANIIKKDDIKKPESIEDEAMQQVKYLLSLPVFKKSRITHNFESFFRIVMSNVKVKEIQTIMSSISMKLVDNPYLIIDKIPYKYNEIVYKFWKDIKPKNLINSNVIYTIFYSVLTNKADIDNLVYHEKNEGLSLRCSYDDIVKGLLLYVQKQKRRVAEFMIRFEDNKELVKWLKSVY